jgi:sRNA-binding regulator protein Hfq
MKSREQQQQQQQQQRETSYDKEPQLRRPGNGGMSATLPAAGSAPRKPATYNQTAVSAATAATTPPAHRVPVSDGAAAGKSKKVPPPMETNAELFYYKKQIDSHTLMVIVLQDGEEIEGTIEWYDRHALKINRTSAPNIMLLKHNIKYMFKAEDRDLSTNE